MCIQFGTLIGMYSHRNDTRSKREGKQAEFFVGRTRIGRIETSMSAASSYSLARAQRAHNGHIFRSTFNRNSSAENSISKDYLNAELRIHECCSMAAAAKRTPMPIFMHRMARPPVNHTEMQTENRSEMLLIPLDLVSNAIRTQIDLNYLFNMLNKIDHAILCWIRCDSFSHFNSKFCLSRSAYGRKSRSICAFAQI